MPGAGKSFEGWEESPRLLSVPSRVFAAPAGISYRVQFYLPDGPPPASGFPAAFVLDGSDQFPILVEAARRLARRADATHVEPLAIIGIDSVEPMSRRFEDYTPWASSEGEEAPPGHLPGSASEFASFLEKDIVEAAKSLAPLDIERLALVGHSLAGYFALYAATRATSHFSVIGALSPSIWWNESELYARLDRVDLARKRFFIAVGSREEEGARAARRMVGRGQDLSGWLSARARESRFRLAEEEDHASVPIACSPALLRFISGG